MPITVKDMLEAAHAAVPRIGRDEAEALIAEGALVLDVRDAPEIAMTGLIAGAHHVSRGMLEFRADPATTFQDSEFRHDRPVVIYCASGGRAALAGKVLRDMGYERVYNLGGLKDWAEAGGKVDHPIDHGM